MEHSNKNKREQNRLKVLEELQILDTANNKLFDNLTVLASQICNTPIALISLIDEKRQWFKSKVGLSIDETEREISFCGHAIYESDSFFEVKDAKKDNRFKDNPLVTGKPNIRFYAGVTLKVDGENIGTLCVIDQLPRELSETQKQSLELLSEQVVSQIKAHKVLIELDELNVHHQQIIDNVKGIIFEADESGKFKFVNTNFIEISGYDEHKLIGSHHLDIIHPEDQTLVKQTYQKLLKQQAKESIDEFRIICKNGEVKWVNQHTHISYDQNGKMISILGIAQNITESKSNQIKLLDTSQQLTSIIETISEGVLVIDTSSKIVLTNTAADYMFNIEQDDFDCDHIANRLFLLDKKSSLNYNPFEEILLMKKAFKAEFYYKQSKSKEGHFIKFSGDQMFDKDGNLIGAVIIISNIHEQKIREYEILKGNQLLEQTQRMAGIGHWEVDLETQLVFWSDETKKIHEVPQSFKPTLEEGINFYEEKSQPIITKAIDKAIKECTSWDEVLQIVTAKNRIRWVRAIGKAHQSDENSSPNKLFGVFQDITEQKEKEETLIAKEKLVLELNKKLEKQIENKTEELETSKANYKKLYNDAPDLMVSIDAQNGTILEINNTTLSTLGYSRSDLIGKTVFKLYDSSSHDTVRKALKKFKITKKIINERLFLRTKDDRIIPVILNANPVYNKEGNIIRTNSIWRDISDLAKAENQLNKLNKELEQRVELRTRELEQVNKELEEFAYMTTHDLKTPLTSIKGHLNILKIECKNQTSEQFKRSMQWIEKSIESAEAKIEAVVKIAKLKEPASQQKEK